jgi:phosphotransferase system enzyme I (PtsI)
VGRGTAYVLACAGSAASPRRDIGADEIAGEIARFQVAVETADRELQALKREVSERIGQSEAEIFAAQALMLGDAAFRGQVSNMIRERRVNAEAALADVIEKFSHAFDEIRDAYLKERAADVRDMGYRVLAALIEETQTEPFEIPEGSIIVAEELSPSLTARLELGRVRGIVTGHGSRFSHTAILARSQGVPAVSAVAHAAAGIKTGDQVVVDGFSGVVFVNPEDSVEREYDRLEREIRAGKERLRDLVPLASVTLDGEPIRLSANVSKIADTESALLHNADGIGLYRTEFGYAIRDRFPTEEEQYELLERAAARVHPRPVAFRLLDVGADKALTYFPLPAARNPSLAERGIRLLLRHPVLLKRQLRAFLRVSASHPISILLPMVVSVEDVRRTRRVIEEAKVELAAEGLAFDAKVPVGAMIEVPAAAFSLHALAREADFFSLGTNDLVQYMLAADREDENVAEYYDPAHPAVLRLIGDLAEGARAAGRPLTICGDMAADPQYTELLLGLGLRGFSVAPGAILDVKDRIRNTSLARAVRLAHELLELGSAEAISARLGQM